MKIKAAIFDMDGTLINSLIMWDVMWSRFGEKYLGDGGFRPSAEDEKRVRTLTLRDAMHLIHKNYSIAESGDALHAEAEHLLAQFYSHEVQMKPGALEFLKYLKAKGVKMCIASATVPALVTLVIEHLGLAPYFSAVFSCGAIGKGKEAPDVFLAAAEYLGKDIGDTWVFEDSLVALETAARIGMPTVAIYDPNNFGQETMKKIANVYVGEGETLMKVSLLCESEGE